MRKILSALILLSLVVVPMVALAQQVPECCKLRRAINLDTETPGAASIMGPATNAYCEAGSVNYTTTKWGLFCLINTINTVVDWIFVVLIAASIIFVILGAMNIMLAGGDPEKFGTGRSYIMYAVIGLIVAFLARSIPSVVKMIMAG